MEWCKNPDVGLPKPDLVMFLQLNPSVAAGRGEFGTERYETSSFQRTVQQRFEQLMKDPSVNWKVNYVAVIYAISGHILLIQSIIPTPFVRCCIRSWYF